MGIRRWRSPSPPPAERDPILSPSNSHRLAVMRRSTQTRFPSRTSRTQRTSRNGDNSRSSSSLFDILSRDPRRDTTSTATSTGGPPEVYTDSSAPSERDLQRSRITAQIWRDIQSSTSSERSAPQWANESIGVNRWRRIRSTLPGASSPPLVNLPPIRGLSRYHERDNEEGHAREAATSDRDRERDRIFERAIATLPDRRRAARFIGRDSVDGLGDRERSLSPSADDLTSWDLVTDPSCDYLDEPSELDSEESSAAPVVDDGYLTPLPQPEHPALASRREELERIRLRTQRQMREVREIREQLETERGTLERENEHMRERQRIIERIRERQASRRNAAEEPTTTAAVGPVDASTASSRL